MTPKEELQYLIDLIIEAGKWERSEGETSALELEIRLRIGRLMDGQEATQSKQEIHKLSTKIRPGRIGKVKVSLPNKKKVWVNREWTELVPCKCSKTGFKHVVKDEYAHLVPGMEPVPNVDLGSV